MRLNGDPWAEINRIMRHVQDVSRMVHEIEQISDLKLFRANLRNFNARLRQLESEMQTQSAASDATAAAVNDIETRVTALESEHDA